MSNQAILGDQSLSQTASKVGVKRLILAYQRVRQLLMDQRNPSGYWVGELSASALSTATTVSTFSFYLSDPQSDRAQFPKITSQLKQGIAWITTQQNKDGGWGDTGMNYSNISTTMLVVAALTVATPHVEETFSSQIENAQRYIQSQGGIIGLRKRYGQDKTFAVPILANCAMAGIVPWKEVAALPFEAACVPQRFYNLMQLPVVSYAIPALVAIGQAKFILDPPWDPVRRLIRQASLGRSLRVLEKMQPASGGYLEAVPLTSFVSMGLIKSGRANHPVVKNGIRFLLDSFRQELPGQGSWPIDTNLATWNTTLAINALANTNACALEPESDQRNQADQNNQFEQRSSVDGECLEDGLQDGLQDGLLNWLLDCQNTDVHPFTGAAPGGWGWSDLSGAVPDADDTPGALIALKNILTDTEFDDSVRRRVLVAAESGIQWLVKLQNRDNGWPTFCRGWGKLPFDRSGNDITAHVLRSFLAWQDHFKAEKIDRSINAGFKYLERHQQKNGSWLPLWFGNQDLPDDINPCYGTAKVLMAYRDANSFDTPAAQFGLRWLRENQNSDGGWGGGKSLTWPDARLGSSSVEETALCTEVMLNDDDPMSQAAAQRGVEWLIQAVNLDCADKSWPIGFYFAKLWYFEQLYPLIFATSALGRAVELSRDRSKAQNKSAD